MYLFCNVMLYIVLILLLLLHIKLSPRYSIEGDGIIINFVISCSDLAFKFLLLIKLSLEYIYT